MKSITVVAAYEVVLVFSLFTSVYGIADLPPTPAPVTNMTGINSTNTGGNNGSDESDDDINDNTVPPVLEGSDDEIGEFFDGFTDNKEDTKEDTDIETEDDSSSSNVN